MQVCQHKQYFPFTKNLYIYIKLARVEEVRETYLYKYTSEKIGEWPVTNKNWRESKKIETLLSTIRKWFNSQVLISTDVGLDTRNTTEFTIIVS